MLLRSVTRRVTFPDTDKNRNNLANSTLIGPDVPAGAGAEDLAGEIACLSAALSYAFAAIYGRRFKGLKPIQVATGQITGSTLALLPLVAVIDHPWTLQVPGADIWGAMIGIAALCTVFAYVPYLRILAVAGATNVLLVTLLEHHRIRWNHLIG